MQGDQVIIHIIPATEWEKVKENHYYYPDQLKKDGFIRCATRDQILNARNYIYKEKIDLKLLYIDTEKLSAEVVYEAEHNAGEKFPHLYGALNLDAVIKVVDFKPNAKGEFELPSLN